LKRLMLAIAALLALASPAGAEKIAGILSTSSVKVTSSFDGTSLSLFGSIEPDTPGGTLSGPYNIIVVITGPLQDRVTRLKTNSWGIWTNTDQVSFRQFPSFYNVLSSGSLEAIADPTLLEERRVLPLTQARATATTGETPKSTEFGTQLVRLMTEQGHFLVREDGIHFLSDSAFVAQVNLPSDVANGPFIARTMLLKDKQLLAERSDGFTVRKTGFESFVYVASRQYPLVYGLVCVALALFAGWLVGVVFRR